MRTTNHLLLVTGCALGIGGLGGVFLVWPAYREAGEITRRVAELEDKASHLDTQNQRVQELAVQVDEIHRQILSDHKAVPLSPDLAVLIRKLSLPVDGRNVLDQEFSAGQPSPAIPGDDQGPEVMPLTVEMKATFEAVFALLRAVESMDRLVRVTSVQLACKREESSAEGMQNPALMARGEADEAPVLSATLGLEAVYDSLDVKEAD